MKSIDLTGRNVIVTGAAGIIGAEVCKTLAECGANLALFDLQNDALEKLCDSLPKVSEQTFLPVVCDLSSSGSIKQAMSQTVKVFGKIDALHNNAATKGKSLEEFFAPFEDFSIETWNEIMSVNVTGLMQMAQEVGKNMLQHGTRGSIIQTASIYGVVAPDQKIYEGSHYLGRAINTPAVYAASKGAVIALTKYLSTYWGEKGIRVNAVTPGGVFSGQNDQFVSRYSAKVPMGRMAEAKEIADAVVYLVSDMSSYVTGQNLIVDGGFTVW